MPSFLKEYGRTTAQKFVANILREGPMPKHVGIIMDGNRRYAKAKGFSSVTDGHRKGDEKVSEVAHMFLDLNIPEVTMYSFSNENFKRSAEEVTGLMKLMTERSYTICTELDDLKEMDIGVEITGDYRKAPSSKLRYYLAKVMWCTKGTTKFKLNTAFAYTGQSEVAKGLNLLLNGLCEKKLKVENVTGKLLENTFNLGKTNPVDIIIRTSGEQRLSDFMMWQSSNGYLDFVHGVTWPEFNNWHLLRAIWQYQLHVVFKGLSINARDENSGHIIKRVDKTSKDFLEAIKLSRWKGICEDAKQTIGF